MAPERVLGPVGTIKAIKTASELGSDGLIQVAVIEHSWRDGVSDAWILVPENQIFEIGDRVRMFSTREGKLRTHSFEKKIT